MNAATETVNDTLAHAIARARRQGVFLVLIFAAAVLLVSVTVTEPNVVVVPGVVRAGAPVVNLRHPQPAHLAEISVSIGDNVRRGETVLELIQVSSDGAGAAIQMVSPVDGTVTALAYVAPGTLIPAFDPILEIAPADSAPLIELAVSPVHAGHFGPGLVVPMAVGTGPAAREFPARVLSVAFPTPGVTRSTAMRAVLEPIAADPELHDALRPGKVVRTRIPVGERSLLGSLLQPASRILDDAFSRR